MFCRVVFKSEWVLLVGRSLLTRILPHKLLLEKRAQCVFCISAEPGLMTHIFIAKTKKTELEGSFIFRGSETQD